MALFGNERESPQEAQRKFREEFGAKVHDEVQDMELAELRADGGVYQDLNLKSYRPSVWGLIVFCRKETWYYVAEQESYLSFFMKGAGKTEERTVCLSQLSDIHFSLPKRTFFSFMNPELARSINASYTNLNGNRREFTLVLNRKAGETFRRLGGQDETAADETAGGGPTCVTADAAGGGSAVSRNTAAGSPAAARQGTDTRPFRQETEDPFGSYYLPSGMARFDAQMHFIAEIDKMTRILRQTLLIDGSRRENDAEHSWHLAVMAQLLAEYAKDTPDVSRAIKMVSVHDLIEIYAGDTYAYDEEGAKSKLEREKQAADRLFGILPADQGAEIRALWEEFDRRETADARYAACLDSLQPFFHNTLTVGHSWIDHGTRRSQVEARQSIIRDNMPSLWPWVVQNLDRAVQKGWLLDA